MGSGHWSRAPMMTSDQNMGFNLGYAQLYFCIGLWALDFGLWDAMGRIMGKELGWDCDCLLGYPLIFT